MAFSAREKFTEMWANAWDWVRQEVFNRQVKEDLEDIQTDLTTLEATTEDLQDQIDSLPGGSGSTSIARTYLFMGS